MSVRHIAMIPTNKWERLSANDASREAAATRGRVANTDLRILVGYRIVRALPHRQHRATSASSPSELALCGP
jgi:hypothetical protein